MIITYEQHKALLMEACMDNTAAVDCLMCIFQCYRVWDNIWDGDKENSKQAVDKAFSDMAFELTRNSFYVQHQAVIVANIAVSWNAWQDSNEWANHDDKFKRGSAWYIRDYCNEIVPLFAWIIRGKDHMRSVSLKIREAYLNYSVESDNGLFFFDTNDQK